MAEFLEKYMNVRLEFGKSSILLKTAVTAAIALSTVVLITMRLNTWQAEEKIHELQQRAAILQMENEKLQQKLDQLDTVEGIRTIAAEELGLVDPETIIFDCE